MTGRSTTEANILLRLMEICPKNLKDLDFLFIDLEKTYYRGPHKVLWWMMEKKGIHIKYTDAVKHH